MDRWLVGCSCAVCAVAAIVAGCGGGAKEKPPASSPEQRIALAVVGIEARIGTGDARSSGIVIDPARGLVVTAAHTVWGARKLKIATAFGVLHGRIVARAPCDDLAVLEISPGIPGLATLPAAPAAAPATGQLLRTLGRRRTSDAGGAIASIPVRAAGPPRAGQVSPLLRAQPQVIPLDSPLVPEVAGGPVLDGAGRLVGMAQTPGMAVSWTHIRTRLRELKPGARSVYVGWAGEYRCARHQQAYAQATHPGYRARDARLNAPVAATRLPGTEGMEG